jgi:hypothetical protein
VCKALPRTGLKILSKHENFTGPTPLSIFLKYALSGAFIWRVVAFIYAGFGLAFSESTPYVLVRASHTTPCGFFWFFKESFLI